MDGFDWFGIGTLAGWLAWVGSGSMSGVDSVSCW